MMNGVTISGIGVTLGSVIFGAADIDTTMTTVDFWDYNFLTFQDLGFHVTVKTAFTIMGLLSGIAATWVGVRVQIKNARYNQRSMAEDKQALPATKNT